LAANLASQILSLPPENFEQAAVLFKKIEELKTFGTAEITYQVALDYTAKINQYSVLASSEDFYKLASDELAQIISLQPNQSKYQVALAWLDLYFSGQDSQRIEKALVLGEEIRQLAPIKKDAYLILVAGYSLKGDKTSGEKTVVQAKNIDSKLGEEVFKYWQTLNQ
jgi:hypothetical protein